MFLGNDATAGSRNEQPCGFNKNFVVLCKVTDMKSADQKRKSLRPLAEVCEENSRGILTFTDDLQHVEGVGKASDKALKSDKRANRE